jgi:hypothetical protein
MPLLSTKKGRDFTTKNSTFLVICLCTVAFDFNCLNESFSKFHIYAVHQKSSQAWVLFFSPEIRSGAQGMKQESGGVQPRAPFDTRYTHDSFPVWISKLSVGRSLFSLL